MNIRTLLFPACKRLPTTTLTEDHETSLVSQYRFLKFTSLVTVLLMTVFAGPALALKTADERSADVHSQSDQNRGHSLWHARNATPKVYGKTIGNWGHTWWQWVSNFPAADDPISQSGLVDCSANQSGKVWFLAGTFGRATERTCSVKKDKAILFPLFNGIFWTAIDPGVPEDCTDEISCRGVSANIDTLTNWSCTVDGTPCVWFSQIVRAQSDARPFDIPEGSTFTSFGYASGLRELSVADGVWVMLDPLPPGSHELRFTATATIFGGFSLDVTYHLTVN